MASLVARAGDQRAPVDDVVLLRLRGDPRRERLLLRKPRLRLPGRQHTSHPSRGACLARVELVYAERSNERKKDDA